MRFFIKETFRKETNRWKGKTSLYFVLPVLNILIPFRSLSLVVDVKADESSVLEKLAGLSSELAATIGKVVGPLAFVIPGVRTLSVFDKELSHMVP